MREWLVTLLANLAGADLPDPLDALRAELAQLRARVAALEAGRGTIDGGGDL